MSATVSTAAPVSATWTFFEGDWHEGNVAIMGPRTHGAWLGSTVFDGARAFDGVAPDLDLHMARVNESARRFMLKPVVDHDTWMGLARDGDQAVRARRRALYPADVLGRHRRHRRRGEIRSGQHPLVPLPLRSADARTARNRHHPFAFPPSDDRDRARGRQGRLPLSQQRPRPRSRRPSRGFDNCLLADMLGNIAELANSNVFMVKDGVVFTPAPNGTFLDGITRQRVIQLLREAGQAVVEASCATPTSRTPTRSSPPATSPRSPRSPGSTNAPCSRAR